MRSRVHRISALDGRVPKAFPLGAGMLALLLAMPTAIAGKTPKATVSQPDEELVVGTQPPPEIGTPSSADSVLPRQRIGDAQQSQPEVPLRRGLKPGERDIGDPGYGDVS